MPHPLLNITKIDTLPEAYLARIGDIFTTFSQQDSGNVAYGVNVGGERFFVKTAGAPDNPLPYLNHPQRVELLRNAVELFHSCDHPALVPLRHVIEESPQGPVLVYDWVDGELLGVPREERSLPTSSYQCFRSLPAGEIVAALDVLFDLHRHLVAKGWIACDLYDGCLLYNFPTRQLRIIDLDTYHRGPFTNTMGEMFGSSRFMAPEEHILGAPIDERTTVFTLGRMVSEFLSDGTLQREAFLGSDMQFAIMTHACQEKREERFGTVAEMCDKWFTLRR